ncbi:hypothetical protein IAT38_007369 [Cryptococcus sp. DSM 104549]
MQEGGSSQGTGADSTAVGDAASGKSGMSSSVSSGKDSQEDRNTTSLSDELKQHLQERLNTGQDIPPGIVDAFLETTKREKAFFIARILSPQEDPVMRESALDQRTPADQVMEIERLERERPSGSLLWLNIMGVEQEGLKGVSSLCGLPEDTLFSSLTRSAHRLHSSHIEFHPTHTYLQLLIQQSTIAMKTKVCELVDPFADMIRNSWEAPKAKKGEGAEGKRRDEDRWTKWVKGEDYKDAVKVGFMSVFMIHRMNILVTISLPYYGDPASRLAIHMSHADWMLGEQLDVSANVGLLGATMIHRVVGYASGSLRQANQTLARWDRDLPHSLSTRQVEYHRKMNTILSEFKQRLKPLEKVHKKFLQRLTDQEKNVGGNRRRPQFDMRAREILEQSLDKLELVVEEVDAAIEKCKHLEEFTFNMMSTRANESMERLAIVTIVFLPLTFIASYFSMGFDEFPDLSRPPIYFWEVSIPLSIVFFTVFAFSNLKRAWITTVRYGWRQKERWGREVYWWRQDVELWWRARVDRKQRARIRAVKQRSGGLPA